MKKLSITTLFLGLLATGFSAQPTQAQVSVSIGRFYDELAPYGRWVDCSYGECWVPERVVADWQPYTNGEWVYTEYGWTWVSYDPWGDDPYHYGTWVFIAGYGWSWVPGTVWAPAWVTWTYSDNYVGWAPLPPSVVFGASGYLGRPVVVSSTRYVFVPTNRFVGTNVSSVRVSPQQSATIFRQTTPITRFDVSGGIVRNTALPLETIQRATRKRIETRNISVAKTAPRPVTAWTRGDRRQVSIVAPAREVRDAIAARPQKGPRSEAPSLGNAGGNARINRRPESTVPRGEVMPQRARPKAPKVDPAPPAESRGQAAPNAPAYGGRRPSETKQEVAPARGRPAPPPAVEANPRGKVKTQQGRGPEKPAKEGKGKGKEKP